jgi:peptidoglycan/LPS O-acetylase OafA/YrhL
MRVFPKACAGKSGGVDVKYRSEIDGLRAVAVAPVVLFHAGVSGLGGGFVGVDVFFVISGFLITSLIIHEQAAGTFTLASFYERRARRILPALFLVVLACLPFAYLWMLPEDMHAFSATVLSVVLFASNFVFYMQSGYFDQAAELKPLLHTWSLAVEEQFYILFPLLLIALHRYGRRIILLSFVSLFFASLFLAQAGGNFEPRHSLHDAGWSWNNQPSWGFYLLPARAWELLLGSIIAFWQFHHTPSRLLTNRIVAETGGIAGLVLILYAILAFDKTTPFPSVYTLVPTVGTALVIVFAREGTIVHRLLSLRVMVGLGLISYSLYLWHYPLFAFARIWSLDAPGLPVFLALTAVSLVLAYLTWRCVEQPFRNRTVIELRTMAYSSAIAACLLALFFSADRFTKGFQYRFPKGEFLTFNQEVFKNSCRRDKSGDWSAACRYGTGEPDVAIIGDSHARSLVRHLGHALGQRGTAVLDMHVAGCAPVRNFLRLYTGDRCRRQDDAFDYLKQAQHLKYVVIATRWATKFEVTRFDNEEGGAELGDPTILFPDKDRMEHPISLADALKASVHELLDDGRTVIIVYPIPEVGWDVPNYMAKLKRRDALKDDITTSYAVFRKRNQQSIAALDAIGQHPNLHRVHPSKRFCNVQREGRCMGSIGLKALYGDTNHPSHQGAAMVVEEIVAKLPFVNGRLARHPEPASDTTRGGRTAGTPK